jgi:hypothetical protein
MLVTMKLGTPAPAALAAVKAGPPAVLPDKQLRITPKVRQAIELLATGKCKTQTEAAEHVGLTRETISRSLAKPHIIEHMRQRAVRTVALAAPRAAEVKAELMDCADNMVRDRSSSFVLAVAGIAPDTAASVNVNIAIKAGYVIDLSSDDRHPLRTVSPTGPDAQPMRDVSPPRE